MEVLNYINKVEMESMGFIRVGFFLVQIYTSFISVFSIFRIC